jgi:rare lipoprotein A
MKAFFYSSLVVLLLLLLSSGKMKFSGEMASETGMASYYNDKHIGKKTASGEIYNNTQFTAAHRTLPFGTEVKITNIANGRSVNVKINDRGPYAKGRLIDISKAAARELGLIAKGVGKVKIEYEKIR